MDTMNLKQMDGDILESESILIVPVSTDSTLKTGFMLKLVKERGEKYKEFRDRYGAAFPKTSDREALFEEQRPVRASDLPLIIWIVRASRSANVDGFDDLTRNLIASLVQWKIDTVAIAAHVFHGQRVSNEMIDELCLMLDEAGIAVEFYA